MEQQQRRPTVCAEKADPRIQQRSTAVPHCVHAPPGGAALAT